jgi:nitrilase
MKVAALQLATLPMSNAKLNEYFKECHEQGYQIAVLGEYVVNHFFKELEEMPKFMIDEQTKAKVEALEYFSKKYNLIIIAPIVSVRGKKIYKEIGLFRPKSTKYRKQDFLINYEHWNEEKFFDNEATSEVKPIIFSHKGWKFGVISGFEVHFDILWTKMMNQGVQTVILPTVSTFGSNYRWNEILKTRAFTSGVYILRVNRVGSFHNEHSLWQFYGETYLVNPDGHIESSLSTKESMLMVELEKSEINDAHSTWKFKEQLKKRGILA